MGCCCIALRPGATAAAPAPRIVRYTGTWQEHFQRSAQALEQMFVLCNQGPACALSVQEHVLHSTSSPRAPPGSQRPIPRTRAMCLIIMARPAPPSPTHPRPPWSQPCPCHIFVFCLPCKNMTPRCLSALPDALLAMPLPPHVLWTRQQLTSHTHQCASPSVTSRVAKTCLACC